MCRNPSADFRYFLLFTGGVVAFGCSFFKKKGTSEEFTSAGRSLPGWVVGFVVKVALQAVLNVAVVTNTIPNTGISLPFFSSGGTSLMMLLGEMGVVLGVSRGEM